ncbi:MAG: hypothetical protein IAE79_21925 [Anaerolinea sp.]|nr:hypothetical protein [Anaerolinea sp.]
MTHSWKRAAPKSATAFALRKDGRLNQAAQPGESGQNPDPRDRPYPTIQSSAL